MTVFREVESTSALWFLLNTTLGKSNQIECDRNVKMHFEILDSDPQKNIIMDKWVKTGISWLRIK